MEINIVELTDFVRRARHHAYAGDAERPKSHHRGERELEFKDGIWVFRNSYAGTRSILDKELVLVDGMSVWGKANYFGLSDGSYHPDNYQSVDDFAKETYEFSKEAEAKLEIEENGSETLSYKKGSFAFTGKKIAGNMKRFWIGQEIFYGRHKAGDCWSVGGLL